MKTAQHYQLQTCSDDKLPLPNFYSTIIFWKLFCILGLMCMDNYFPKNLWTKIWQGFFISWSLLQLVGSFQAKATTCMGEYCGYSHYCSDMQVFATSRKCVWMWLRMNNWYQILCNIKNDNLSKCTSVLMLKQLQQEREVHYRSRHAART